MSGKIDEVRIYNRALSAEEIRYHYNRGGPVGYWKFDEGSVLTAYDSSGQGNTGTLQNNMATTSWVAGKSGSALSFDGVNDYVNVPDSNSLDLTTAITVSAWISLNSVASQPRIVFKNSAYQFTIDTDKTIMVAIGNTVPGWAWIDSNETINLNEWTSLAFTYDSSNIKIYKNGKLVNTTSGSGAISTNTNILEIGSCIGCSIYTNGLIDDVRIYNYARSPLEILQDYNGGFSARLK